MRKLDLEQFDFIATLILTLGWFAMLTVILISALHSLSGQVATLQNQTHALRLGEHFVIINSSNVFNTTPYSYVCYKINKIRGEINEIK